MAAMQNAAPVMDAAFVRFCSLVTSVGHWHGPQAPMRRPRSAEHPAALLTDRPLSVVEFA